MEGFKKNDKSFETNLSYGCGEIFVLDNSFFSNQNSLNVKSLLSLMRHCMLAEVALNAHDKTLAI